MPAEPLNAAVRFEGVVCPFCALGCDDLVVEVQDGKITVGEGVPPSCSTAFEQPPGDAAPRISGKPATLEQACVRAAELLAISRLPVISGLGTDTDGVRAVLHLVEAVGGVVDHMHSEPLLANVRVMQTGGWVTGTLAEVRTRADLVLLFGTHAVQVMPRFFEHMIWPHPLPDGAAQQRQILFLGEGLDVGAGRSPAGRDAELIACPTTALAEIAAVLRALVAGHRVTADSVAGIPLATLQVLATRLNEAAYAVIVWAAAALPQDAAELTVTSLAELLKDLNTRTRAVGLPLAAPDNAVGANQVTGWSWGVPLRTSLASGLPDYDPEGWSAQRLLAEGIADAQLWISTFASLPPPAAPVPTVALVRSGTSFTQEPEVVIPVGTPGLDHAGSVFRTDSVVALPLQGLRDLALPRAADVLEAIRRRLPAREPA